MISVVTQIGPEDSLILFEAMLKSVSFAKEIVIFNLGRTDKEAFKLFSKYEANVISVKIPSVIEVIRSRQVEAAKYDWVLVMDYDELITPGVVSEITTLVANKGKVEFGAYAIPRRNFSLGYPLSHGGFGDDYVVRFLYKPAFKSWPKNIHSTPTFTGNLGKLIHFMEHHKDASLTQMVEKTNRYSEVESTQYFRGGLKPVTSLTLFRKWWMEFLRRGIFKGGLLDGKIGLIQALYQGYSVFISYAKLYEKQGKKGNNDQE